MVLKPERMENDSNRELAIFIEAIKVPVQDRGAFLDRICGCDEELRRKVEAVIKAHDRIGSFLEKPPTGLSNE